MESKAKMIAKGEDYLGREKPDRIEQIHGHFERDTKNHKMKVLKDDGVYRHLRFWDGSSSNYLFELITFPEYLVYTGDMGSFVFQRTEDMFSFFRGSKNHRLEVNPPYWLEKLEAVDRCDGALEFDHNEAVDTVMGLVEERLNAVLDGLEMEEGYDPQAASEWKLEMLGEAESTLNGLLDNGHEVLFREEVDDAFVDFKGLDGVAREWYLDLSDTKLTRYTFRYIWCLLAIVWGIRKYDEFKQTKET